MSNATENIDQLELAMQEAEPVNCEVTHSFVPGFYVRTVVMPAGALITSLIHNTEHPYFVSEGVANVMINDELVETIEAPYAGVTFPGTRRVLYIVETCKWVTFHPILDSEYPAQMLEEEVSEAIEKICERIITKHENKLLGGVIKNNVVTKVIQNENY